MKTIHADTGLTPAWPLEKIAPPENILFFAIETTGFSANISAVCLIGCLYYETASASWKIIQWFSENPEDEPALLRAFFTFLGRRTTIIHYNGDAFDLPFIRRRSQFHHIDSPLSDAAGTDLPLSGITSIDLYRKIRPWKTALSLTSLKQKAMEHFLGIRRTDPCTGRQLIAAYQDYLSTRKNALYHMLLAHNQEDLRGLLQLLPLLTYAFLPDMTFSLIRQAIITEESARNFTAGKVNPEVIQQDTKNSDETNGSTDSRTVLELLYRIPDLFGSFPAPFHLESPLFSLHGQDNGILCHLPMYTGELKYFYPDYKNYYYLPCEDMAVHKSVGSYVAREARKKATPQTCYSKKAGVFLPQLTPLWQPVFSLAYQSSPSYVEYREELFSNPQNADSFLHQLFP